MIVRFRLDEARRAAVDAGRFVRADLGRERELGAFGPAADALGRSLLVGRSPDDGSWRAYANVCRHRALPLDLGAESPMSDDGRWLLCHQHGALYRLTDGVCVAGPCAGARLASVPVREEGGELVIELE
jgi:nitrite reductase/ring-hydroxylating ferredoxin subunit